MSVRRLLCLLLTILLAVSSVFVRYAETRHPVPCFGNSAPLCFEDNLTFSDLSRRLSDAVLS